MPGFDERARSNAAPEEVWKLLYDPARFPAWWVGIKTVELAGEQEATDAEGGRYTMYPVGYPDFPMPQVLQSSYQDRSVKISCLVSDLCFEWTLEPLDGGEATAIWVHVEIPEHEAHRLESQRDAIRRSVAKLAELAAHFQA